MLDLFGLGEQAGPIDAGVRVIDKDGNGAISIGDTAVLSAGSSASVNQIFRDLSAEDVAAINKVESPVVEPPTEKLSLTDAQKDRIRSTFNLPRLEVNSPRKIEVTDHDRSGTISEGDLVDGGSIIPRLDEYGLGVRSLFLHYTIKHQIIH